MTTRTDKTRNPARAMLTTLLGLCFLWCGCGDAYSTQVPPQKLATTMEFVNTNYARVGESIDLEIVIFTPEVINFITGYDFGTGVDVTFFDIGSGMGCESVDTTAVEVPNLFSATHLFPVCISAIVQTAVETGERTVSIEIDSGGTPMIARAVFNIIRPLPSPL